MISMADNFLKEIDRISKTEHRTRSEFLRDAVRHYLSGTRKDIDEKSLKIKTSLKIQSEIAQKLEGKWDSVDFFREWRNKR